ncbi:MAG TPA: hypothetical protein VH022_01690 [Candidatus Acidoferrum sp.]|jgi:hypothetical protein|nr:hypothetical protein [Candidatus Acidoferrum sp.]
MTMQSAKDFQSVARESGFVEVGEVEEGGVLWFRNAAADAGSAVHKRLCVDSLTNSATVFWETAPSAKLNSMTFRTASALRAWLELKVGEPV